MNTVSTLEQEILNRVLLSHSSNAMNYLAAARLNSAQALEMMQEKESLDVDPQRVLDEAAEKGIRFLVPWMPEYPGAVTSLAHVQPRSDVAGEPVGLWVRGSLDLHEVTRTSVAVIGSRSATSYGTTVAGDIAYGLAHGEKPYTVVSGGAFGIDQAAHRGALAGEGKTVVVLACGVDRAYPAAHRQLFERIVESGQGLIVSECAPSIAPTRMRFLARNRIIAALSNATVIVEGSIRSGAVNTVEWALDLHKPVFGVPGPVTSATSQGVHYLLRGGARLVTSAGDIITDLERRY